MNGRAAWPQRAQTPASLSRFPKSTLEEVFVEGGGEILPKTLGNEVSLGSPEAGRKGTGLAQTFLRLAHDAGGGTGGSWDGPTTILPPEWMQGPGLSTPMMGRWTIQYDGVQYSNLVTNQGVSNLIKPNKTDKKAENKL